MQHSCKPSPHRRHWQEEGSLLVANAAKFNNWFNVDVQESTEVGAASCSTDSSRRG